jgi:hypothetical protein
VLSVNDKMIECLIDANGIFLVTSDGYRKKRKLIVAMPAINAMIKKKYDCSSLPNVIAAIKLPMT